MPRPREPVTHPLMHRTRSPDYAVILSAIDMMLDDTSCTPSKEM
jgi:hypothetical protein